MMKYRICKNDDYYKTQRLRTSIVLFGRIIRKEKWVDTCFNKLNELELFKTIEEAEEVIAKFQQQDRRNINWTWVGRIYE